MPSAPTDMPAARQRQDIPCRRPRPAAAEAGRHVAWLTLEAFGVLVHRHRPGAPVTTAITKIVRAGAVVVDDIRLMPWHELQIALFGAR